MLIRRALPLFLVLWVSVLCPALCGLRLSGGNRQALMTDCCGNRAPADSGPDAPPPPADNGAERCFCSGIGLTVGHAESFHATLLPTPFPNVPQIDASPARHPVIDLARRSHDRPPDGERVLPLLI